MKECKIFLAISFVFAGCSGGTQAGNPNATPAVRTSVTVRLGQNVNSSLTSLQLCVGTIRVPVPGSDAVVASGNGNLAVSPTSAVDAGVIALPNQTLTQVELDLSPCSGSSVSLTNANGAFGTADPVTLRFTGSFTIAPSTRVLELGITAIADQLASVASAAQVKTAAESASGTINSIDAFSWVGLGNDTNWTTPANWYGGVVPGWYDTAIFDANCGTHCNATINIYISIDGMRMNAGYPGTITQSSQPYTTIRIGTSGWRQDSGTFVGGASDITMYSPFHLGGGQFTSTNGTLQIDFWGKPGTLLAIEQTGGAFNPGSGTVSIVNWSDSTIQVNSVSPLSFWNLSLFADSSCCSPSVIFALGGGQTWQVLHQFQMGQRNTLGQVTLQGGQIDLLGDVKVNGGASASTTTKFRFTGSQDQTYVEALGSTLTSAGLSVSKPAGTLLLGSDLTLQVVGESMDVGSASAMNLQGHALTVPGTLTNNGSITKGGGTLSLGAYVGSGTIAP